MSGNYLKVVLVTLLDKTLINFNQEKVLNYVNK